MEIDPEELRRAVEDQHGGRASLVESVPICEEVAGHPAWVGIVHLFRLTDNPYALMSYAWSDGVDKEGRPKIRAVLHAGLVRSPEDAVRGAILDDSQPKAGDDLRA